MTEPEQPKPDSVDRITDPKRLRALAHPLRWKLLDLIDGEHAATATRCAELLGESVASCSYHLNMLAKYGFVEQAPGGQGREKPWRLTSRHQEFTSEGLGVEGQLAAEAAVESLLDAEFEQIRQAARRKSREPEQWRTSTGLSSSSTYLTPEETRQIRDEFIAVLDKYIDRWDKPELRPEGARQVRLFMSAYLRPANPGA